MLKHYSLFLLLVRQNILLLCEQIFKHSDICLLFQSLAFGGVSLRLSLLNFIDIPLNGALLLCLSPIQQTLVKLVTLIQIPIQIPIQTPSRMPRALTEGPVGGGDSGSPPRRGGGGQITVKYAVLCTREQNWTSKRARLKIDPSSHLP